MRGTRTRVALLALAASLGCGDDGGAANQGVARADQAGATTARPVPRGPEHAVFSLDDNRLLAHVQRAGGVVALAGSPGLAKYAHFGKPKLGWKLRQVADGRKVAIADAYADLDLPLTVEQAAAATAAYVRLSSPVARRMDVKLNGKVAAQVTLAAGWQTVSMPLPAGAARAGENRVQLIFSRGPAAAVEWLQLGGQPAGDDAPPLYDAAKRALVLPEGGGLAYYVQVPSGGRLVGDVGGAGCDVAVHARAAAGAAVEGVLRGEGSAVELSPLAGKVVRLSLAARGCKEARLARGALAVPGPTPTVARPKKPKHVIFWIMDSLRADRVKPFFPRARAEVPNFERLATTAALFKNAYVQGNESRASHASIWSAVYVGTHRVIPGGNRNLDPRYTTLGEAMKGAGFFTSGVSANGFITKQGGFGDGWDAYRNHIHQGGGVRGEDVWKFAAESVASRLDRPFFLYMGTIDTHVSWRAKEPWFSKYDPAPYNGKFQREASGTDIDRMAVSNIVPSERDRTRIVAIYDSNVSYQDDLIGKVQDQLKAWGAGDDTMVVILADHGDEQWEDGRVGHGASLRESLVHVPLVIYYPPLFPGGVIEEGVDTIDVLPTMLDAVGLSPPAEAQGASLVPLAQGVGRGYPRPSIASQYEFAHAMRLGDWKLLAKGGEVRVWDLSADPLEKTDLASSRPVERRFLTDALSTFLVYQKDWKKARWGVASNAAPGMADELER